MDTNYYTVHPLKTIWLNIPQNKVCAKTMLTKTTEDTKWNLFNGQVYLTNIFNWFIHITYTKTPDLSSTGYMINGLNFCVQDDNTTYGACPNCDKSTNNSFWTAASKNVRTQTYFFSYNLVLYERIG